MGFLDKVAKVADKIANNEADIIEAGGWGNKAEADVIRGKSGKNQQAKGTKKK